MIYPNSTPEFRILKKSNNEQVLQVRYVNQVQGYTGQWMDIPIVNEEKND